jgi:hypothetical protein
MSNSVGIGNVYGDISGIIAGRDVKNANLIKTGDVTGSNNRHYRE